MVDWDKGCDEALDAIERHRARPVSQEVTLAVLKAKQAFHMDPLVHAKAERAAQVAGIAYGAENIDALRLAATLALTITDES